MGLFDGNVSKKYNDAIPSYDETDGIDRVKCEEECRYRDVEKGICLFETCIYKVYPHSIPCHDKFTRECDICGETYSINTIAIHPALNCNALEYSMCPYCMNALKKLIKENREDA